MKNSNFKLHGFSRMPGKGGMCKRLLPLLIVSMFAVGCSKQPIISPPGEQKSEGARTPVIKSAQLAPDFTIAILPDPQYYTSSQNGGLPAMFTAQTNWIRDNKVAENIAYVACMGDLSDHGNTYASEWTNARAATDVLHNNNIPYGVTVGNHDQSPNTGHPLTCSTSSFRTNYGVSRMSSKSWWGGYYSDDSDSHFDLFTAGGLDWIAVYIEYDSWNDNGTAMNQWAYDRLAQYPGRKAIIVTHQAIDETGAWSYTGSGGYYQGQAIYNKLKTLPNLAMILCGHINGRAYRTDVYTTGANYHTVRTILSDFQSGTNGGNGWMRLMKISTAGNTINVKSYSPYLDQWIPGEEFTVGLFDATSVRGDVTGDRKADFVALHTGGTAYVYPGAASGVFSSSAASFAGSMNSALFDGTNHLVIDVSDVNGDGRSDLVTAFSNGTVYTYFGQSDGTFSGSATSFAGSYNLGTDGTSGHWPVAVVDVNRDGYADLVSEYNGSIYTYKGASAGSFTGGSVSSFGGTFNSAMTDGVGHYLIDVANVNDDLYPDLITANTNGSIYIFTGTSTGSFNGGSVALSGIDLAIPDGTGFEPIGLGDVNGDSKADLVMANTDGNVYVYLSNGDGTFSAGLNVGAMSSSLFSPTHTGYEFIGLADVTGDGRADLMAANSSYVYVFPGQSDGYFGTGAASFNGTYPTTRWNNTPGFESVLEKSFLRRRGCLSTGCY